MHHSWAVVEGLLARVGAVDELVADHELAGLDVRLQAAGGGGRDQASHPQRGHGPHVRAVVDGVRRDAMVLAVARQKCDSHLADAPDRDRVTRSAVRRVYGYLFDVAVDQRIETRAAEDADIGAVLGLQDLGQRHVAAQTATAAALRTAWASASAYGGRSTPCSV